MIPFLENKKFRVTSFISSPLEILKSSNLNSTFLENVVFKNSSAVIDAPKVSTTETDKFRGCLGI